MKRLLSILLIICLAGCLSACGQKEDTDSSQESSAGGAAVSVPPLLGEVKLEELLTVEQVSEVVGKTVGEAQVYEDGIWVRYNSEDFTVTVDINMEPASEEAYTAVLEAHYTDLEEDPVSGALARWSPQSGELLNLSKGYMIGVRVEISKAKPDALRAARQLMALLVEALPEA